MSAPTGKGAYLDSFQDIPLRISGGAVSNPFDEGSPIVKLIRSMPQIVHLTLIDDAWTILTLPSFRDWFPSLLELEMTHLNNEVEALESLPDGLKLETFILYLDSDGVPFEMLLDVVTKTGAKLFKVDEWFCHEHHNNPEFTKTIAALHENGVTTISVDGTNEKELNLT